MTIHFETLGCKLNQIESESAANSFSMEGFSISMKPLTRELGEQNDVILCIVNTCTVTGKAEQKARRVIHLLLDLCPGCPILVTGCYAELDSEILQAIHERIIVLPGSKKGLLPETAAILKDICEHELGLHPSDSCPENAKNILLTLLKERIISITKKPVNPQTVFTLSTDTFFQHSRSSIKIQDGCNNHCTYCRIRLARGTSQSLDPKTILERVCQLEKTGHREVIVTGVNLSQYKSFYNDSPVDIASLLEILLLNTHQISFRISSLYPERVDDALCQVLAHPRIRPHFHLSVQSGSDRILQLMKRPYNAKQVTEAVKRLRSVKKDAFIACDIITGFPGETEEDFSKTLIMCKELQFTWIHAFPFSSRPGTEAYTMKPAVGAQIASKRVSVLADIAKDQKRIFVQEMKGRKLKAIVEKRKELPLRAVTENFLHAELLLPGNIEPSILMGKEIVLSILDESSLHGCEAKAEFIDFV